ncbi:MAG: disaggregatase related repeat-containing protein [Euryarchaeota archaeon]|nr:disaggregatase related repeat-containing protein [Euryarchaeota archaeon]
MALLNQKLIIFFTVFCLALSGVPGALCAISAPVVYVAGDGSGDFNCDGKDDHIQINQALKFVAENSEYTTVRLKGPFTYIIGDTLLIGSNTILEGDSSVKIKLVSNANWESEKPMIKERSSGSHDITIRGFTIDGNREGNTNVRSGGGYHNLIHLSNCQNINVYNMNLTNNHGDGLKTNSCSNVKLYNSNIYNLGHDGLYASSCSGVEAYNNTVICRINSGLRLYNSNKASLHDNVITSDGTGGVGIQIQKHGYPLMNDIKIYNNVIYKTACAGMWIFGSGSYPNSSANLHIHHNQIYDTGITTSSSTIIGGIMSDGFDALIENNVIDGVYGAGIIQKNVYSSPLLGSGYVLTLRNNIITNSRSARGGSGYAVSNELTGTHSFVLYNNCFYGNTAGNYKNVQDSPSDLKADPLYADRNNHDYHIKSKAGRWDGKSWVTDDVSSPCIDAGYIHSDYSEEPLKNGGRINIGAFGNTKYASKSGTSAEKLYDNRLREASPDTVFQDTTFIDVGGMSIGRYRDLMWFDLSEYNDISKIDNVALSLYWYYPEGKTRPADTVIEVYRPASSWDPDYISWNMKKNGVTWTYPGGDWYDKKGVLQGSTPYATLTIKGSTLPDNRYYKLDVTDLVKEYVSGKYANTGFFIKARSENNNYIAFYSNECGKEAQKPKLDVKIKTSSGTVPVAPKIPVNIILTGATDNRLREASPDAVLQDTPFIDVGGMSTGRYRDLMWFDLSEYKDASKIDNVALSLYWYYPKGTTRPKDTVIEVYRPASTWDPRYVSWNKMRNGVVWTNPGGDWKDKNDVLQGRTPYATLTIKGSTLPDNRYYKLDVTDLVKEYVSGKYANTGFFIKARDENNNYIAFYSNEAGGENQRPKLDLILNR